MSNFRIGNLPPNRLLLIVYKEMRIMEEKIFNLIESMYNEMNNRFEQMDKKFEQMDKKFEQMDKKFEQIDKRFDEVNAEIVKNRTAIVELENRLGDKIDALFDGYKFNTEAIQRNARDIKRVEAKVDALALRVDRHDEEIAALKRVR
jgi:chromosome segregation ATPase